MKKCVIIYNPHSGKKVKSNFLAEYVDLLWKNDYDSEVVFSKYKGHIKKIVKELPECDLVISIGGDGTFNEAVTGNLQREKKLLLSHIPLGTTNDIGAMFGYGNDIVENLKSLLDGVEKEIDICTVNGKPFVYVSGFGKFMTIPYETSRSSKKKFGKMAYLIDGVKEFFDHTKLHELTYRVNGEEYKGLFSFILVSNANHIAGVNNFYNNVYLNDGKFEVLFCNLTRKKDIIKSLVYLTASDISKVPGFYFYKTDKLEIEFTNETSKWCVDGEELEEKTTTYNIEMINDFKIMLPKKNIEKLFVNPNKIKTIKTKTQPLVERVKSIIKK